MAGAGVTAGAGETGAGVAAGAGEAGADIAAAADDTGAGTDTQGVAATDADTASTSRTADADSSSVTSIAVATKASNSSSRDCSNAKQKKARFFRTKGQTSKSIYFRLFSYFIVFALAMMLLLWLLQILFLQFFYQNMKISELYNAADTIEENYGKSTLIDTINNLTSRSDMYVQIEKGGVVLYRNNMENPGDRMNLFARTYNNELLKQKLAESDSDFIVAKQNDINQNSAEAVIYASILETDDYGEATYLFIYSPLSAVGTTIDILARQLLIVTFISIIFGVVMSLLISRRLAKPLNQITASAAELAQGRFDVSFDGNGYAETEELAATLNYAADELSKSDKLQKDLVANVTHDLKTPLTMVKSYAEMIRDLSGDNPEKRNKHLEVIISEADRLNELVNDLTALSKMQANVDTLDLRSVNLRVVAQETMDSFLLHAEKDGFTFTLNADGDTVVMADEKKIHRVFANLIGNAVRYSSERKDVTININDLGDYVRCEVRDHGQGIPAEELENIWDRYYQSSSNHSRTSKGSGLGLSIVKQIFVLHHARYGVDSIENEGSTFWFELPRALQK